MIKLKSTTESSSFGLKSFIFGGGERHVQLVNDSDEGSTDITKIDFRYEGDASLFELAFTVDAIRRMQGHGTTLDLFIPYFPGARQDRVCNPGEALSVKVYADFINHLRFDTVTIFDPHSEVTPALIDNCVVVNNHELVKKSLDIITMGQNTRFSDIILVSPDAGSNKKIYDVAKYLGGKHPVIRADKLRDVSTGKIIETVVYADDLTGKICVIVDDICSKGGTFKALAKKLKELGADTVYLVVSHFEATANLHEMLESGIDKIFTTDSFPYIESNDYNKNGYIDIIKLTV